MIRRILAWSFVVCQELRSTGLYSSSFVTQRMRQLEPSQTPNGSKQQSNHHIVFKKVAARSLSLVATCNSAAKGVQKLGNIKESVPVFNKTSL